jgi:hypothetical protein
VAELEPLETIGANLATEAEVVHKPARTFPPIWRHRSLLIGALCASCGSARATPPRPSAPTGPNPATSPRPTLPGCRRGRPAAAPRRSSPDPPDARPADAIRQAFPRNHERATRRPRRRDARTASGRAGGQPAAGPFRQSSAGLVLACGEGARRTTSSHCSMPKALGECKAPPSQVARSPAAASGGRRQRGLRTR